MEEKHQDDSDWRELKGQIDCPDDISMESLEVSTDDHVGKYVVTTDSVHIVSGHK
jgi:hypothetical protein